MTQTLQATLITNAEERQKKELRINEDSNQIHSIRGDNKDGKTNQENYKIICRLCTGNHKTFNCEKLKNESTENRRNLVKQKKLASTASSTHA